MYSSIIHTQWNGMQKNYSFSASFKDVSLVGSDNLLTHTSSDLERNVLRAHNIKYTACKEILHNLFAGFVVFIYRFLEY